MQSEGLASRFTLMPNADCLWSNYLSVWCILYSWGHNTWHLQTAPQVRDQTVFGLSSLSLVVPPGGAMCCVPSCIVHSVYRHCLVSGLCRFVPSTSCFVLDPWTTCMYGCVFGQSIITKNGKEPFRGLGTCLSSFFAASRCTPLTCRIFQEISH